MATIAALGTGVMGAPMARNLARAGHEERDVQGVVREVLAKLPDEHEIRAIDLKRELARRRDTAA